MKKSLILSIALMGSVYASSFKQSFTQSCNEKLLLSQVHLTQKMSDSDLNKFKLMISKGCKCMNDTIKRSLERSGVKDVDYSMNKIGFAFKNNNRYVMNRPEQYALASAYECIKLFE